MLLFFLPFKIGLNAVLWCCLHITLKRSKVSLEKSITLTVTVNETKFNTCTTRTAELLIIVTYRPRLMSFSWLVIYWILCQVCINRWCLRLLRLTQWMLTQRNGVFFKCSLKLQCTTMNLQIQGLWRYKSTHLYESSNIHTLMSCDRCALELGTGCGSLWADEYWVIFPAVLNECCDNSFPTVKIIHVREDGFSNAMY